MTNIENKEKCPYCGSEATISSGKNLCDVDCPTCGNYKYKGWPFTYGGENKNEVASFLYYKKVENKDKHYVITDDKSEGFDNNIRPVSLDEILSFYPCNFAERIDAILLGFAKQSEYLGAVLSFTMAELISALFIKRYDKEGNDFSIDQVGNQMNLIIEFLEKNGYMDFGGTSDEPSAILKPEGWKRVDELQLNQSNNKNVFVSMAFNDGTKDVREAIRESIIDSGYSPEFIDEIIHNKQIVPEMFRLIKESRFLILEITDPNYGAYYEAGYALGLDKEVIICCSKEIFTKDFGEEEKYRKPHFDIAQKQILIWEDLNDLRKKLSEWIKAIVG